MCSGQESGIETAITRLTTTTETFYSTTSEIYVPIYRLTSSTATTVQRDCLLWAVKK